MVLEPRSDSSFLEQILGALPAAVLVFDQNEKLLFANPTAERLLHLVQTPKKPLGFDDVFGKNCDLKKRFLNTLKTSRGFRLHQIELAKPQIPPLEIEIEAVYAPENSTESIAAVFLVRDATEHANLEAELRHRERLAALGTIASGLAHELRNPLGGIRAASEMLVRSDSKIDKEIKEFPEIILKETERILKLVDQLLDLAKPRRLTKTEQNIHLLLDEILLLEESLFKAHHIQWIRQYDPSLPYLIGHTESLKQVFLNLIKNACDAIGKSKNGAVIVRTRLVHDYQLQTSNGRQQFVEISIIDNGCGMSDETLKNLFSPFYTTKPAGVGLGLSICHRMIEEHEGFIEVQSTLGKGSVFKVFLKTG